MSSRARRPGDTATCWPLPALWTSAAAPNSSARRGAHCDRDRRPPAGLGALRPALTRLLTSPTTHAGPLCRGNKIGKVHTVPTKVTGECGSVLVRLIPAPRGAGIVAARTPKKVLQMAGIEDCYTCSRGSTKTLGNTIKVGGTAPAVPRAAC